MKIIAVAFVALVAGCAVQATPTCTDGIRNGNESDVDCGGGTCGPCGLGRVCRVGADCATLNCAGGVCAAAATNLCSDMILDGSETDIDCGGPTCAPCSDGRMCMVASDCRSQLCSGGRCLTAASNIFPDFSQVVVFHIDPGAGIVVQPGVQAGYGITANLGGLYRLVWTGDGTQSGQYREFYGSVWTPGAFSTLTPGCVGQACPLMAGDYVSPQPQQLAGGQRIDFDAAQANGLSGIDFSVTLEPVYFDLYIDGTQQPALVFFSSGGVQSGPTALPFGLVTQ
jgi:hypothetical protein